jgi:hypothetical protein
MLFKGRISAAGFIPKDLIISSTRDTSSSSISASAPESVLFRRKNAPTRYHELDIYFAHTGLESSLPESDLLKALHCYTSDFYSRAAADEGIGDWYSMDETALLALGILMEETARERLGQNGDLVFTEGEEIDGLHTSQKPIPGKKTDKARATKRRRLDEDD